jgi:ankyrin repeat protein
VKALISAGASLDLQDSYDMTTLLHTARRGYTEILKLLIASGASIDLGNTSDVTALMRSALSG